MQFSACIKFKLGTTSVLLEVLRFWWYSFSLQPFIGQPLHTAVRRISLNRTDTIKHPVDPGTDGLPGPGTTCPAGSSVCVLGCCQLCDNEEYGKKLEATGNQSYYFTLKSPYTILATESYMENMIEVIRLIPDIPGSACQIKVEVIKLTPSGIKAGLRGVFLMYGRSEQRGW